MRGNCLLFSLLLLSGLTMGQAPGFLETFNGKTKGKLQTEGWEFFPNSGFAISTQEPYDQQYVRANAGEGNNEFLATPCVDFDTDLDTISFYYRSFGNTQGFFTLGWQSAFDPLGINVAWLDTTPVVTTWTYLAATYDPPDTPDVCRLVFGFGTLSSGSGGKLGIDHFRSEQAILVYNCCDSFITCDSVLLPLVLLEFTAELSDGDVKLQWTTAQESRVSHYVIERSNDGLTFEAVGTLASQNAGFQPVNYAYEDALGAGRLAYYRLRVVDNMGMVSYSDVVMVESPIESNVMIYPNPVIGSDLYIHTSGNSDTYQVRLFSLVGELVESQLLKGDDAQSVVWMKLPESLQNNEVLLVEVCTSTGCWTSRVAGMASQ
jgi:hypothetical protein